MTDEIPTSTISPELRIKELEEALKQETERVLKVYDAFSAQEQEITTLKDFSKGYMRSFVPIYMDFMRVIYR